MALERVGEGVDRLDPVAVHRMAAVAQRAIDQFDVVLASGQYDQRYLCLGHPLH
jgi:hypothetical protein